MFDPSNKTTSFLLVTFSALNVSVIHEDLSIRVPVNLQYYRAKMPP